jgi:predicted enzyme related to lactoylglutathione lyase
VSAAGRLAWLELNAHRAPLAQAFYRDLFGWSQRPIHVAPFGTLPLLVNGDREIASVFTAMGHFAPPRWLVYLTADIDASRARVSALGGREVSPPDRIDGWGRSLPVVDPEGTQVTLFEPEGGEPPAPARPGDPLTAELWARDGETMAAFWAELLDVPRSPAGDGWILGDGPAPLRVRTNPYAAPPYRWIAYFRSAGVGGDRRRAVVLGAVPQGGVENVPGLGELALLSDPAGAIFGLVDPGDGE